MNDFLGRLGKYFLQGTIFLVPLAIIAYVVWGLYELLREYSFTDNPFVSLLIILFGIFLLGYLTSSLITRPLFNAFERLLKRAPGINFIYTSIKDLLEAFVGDKKKFDRPVLVKLNKDNDLYKLGFITEEELDMLGLTEMVAVYLPHSYNFSGNLFVVPKDHITPIEANAGNVMKFIVSGGVSGFENKKDKKPAELPPEETTEKE